MLVNKRAHGFSLIELMVVVAILAILVAMSIPQIQRVQTRYRLDTSGHAVAGLVQQARLQAVRNNQPAYAQFDPGTPNLMYVNNDKTAYVAGNGESVVTTNGTVTLQTANGGLDLGQLNAYLGVGTGSIIVEQPGTPVGFNARGLPCVGAAGNPSVCQQQDGPGGALIPAFLLLMTTGQGDWEAVTVTAAGRTKAWQMARGDTSCGFNNCWK
jgi:prepilin-type N-terminal cleavage/methylation domain-containing protein